MNLKGPAFDLINDLTEKQKSDFNEIVKRSPESRESLLVEHYTRGLSSYDTKRLVRLKHLTKRFLWQCKVKNLKYHMPTENPNQLCTEQS